MATLAALKAKAMKSRPERCRRKFLAIFPAAFLDATYLAWERDYKWEAHRLWVKRIGGKAEFRSKLDDGRYREIAAEAVRIESNRSLLFSFEKMTLRDAVVRSDMGTALFAHGLYDWLHGTGREADRFEDWLAVLESLPRRQRRIASWPIVTVFGFIARPRVHAFLKPVAMQRAAAEYGFDLDYSSRPSWATYSSFLGLCQKVRSDLSDLRPRDQIDAQSFLWVQGSTEYA
jgi:hypothetical protein